MTILKALSCTINFPLPDDTLEKALIDSELDPDTAYTKKDHERGIDLCAAGLLYLLLTTGDEKEGGYALTMPSVEKIKLAYGLLVGKWGEPNLIDPPAAEPTVSGESPW